MHRLAVGECIACPHKHIKPFGLGSGQIPAQLKTERTQLNFFDRGDTEATQMIIEP